MDKKVKKRLEVLRKRVPQLQQLLAAATLFKNFEQGFITSQISRRVGEGKLKIFHES